MHRYTRRGLSPIISTLLMLLLVVAFGSGVMIWSSGSLSTFSASQAFFLRQGTETIKERFIVELVEFNSTAPKSINVHIRNVGENNIKIDAISIVELSEASIASDFEAREMTVDNSCDNIADPTGTVEVDCWKTFTFTFSFNTGQVYKVTVATTNGNKAVAYGTA